MINSCSMRKSALPLEKLHTFVKFFFSNAKLSQQTTKRGRPREYDDTLIISLWLYQTLNGYSYRETLEKAQQQGFEVPSLHDYYYRVEQLDEELLKLILEECAKLLLHENKIQFYIADATGFAFGDKYNLNWQRGTEVRTVKSHVRLEVIAVVDEDGKRVITAVETGGPYASEVKMLKKALERIETSKKVPFIADRGYDAVDIVQKLLEKGFEPAIKIKETMRMRIRHPLRKLSKGNWGKYGKNRYMIEQMFGSIKQKVGSSFMVLREDIARKAALACAILWNFYILATFLFLSLLFYVVSHRDV